MRDCISGDTVSRNARNSSGSSRGKAVDAGFRGVALFALGYADTRVWTAVDTVAAGVAATSPEAATSDR